MRIIIVVCFFSAHLFQIYNSFFVIQIIKVSQIVTAISFICKVELKQEAMTTTYALRQSTHQFLPFGTDFSKKDDHLGVYNSQVLEDLVDGELQREYYFQTRKFGSVYVSVVSKLVISDQTWNSFMGTFTLDRDVEVFIDGMINTQDDSDLLGLIGNNLPKYPDVLGLVLMGESIYNA